MKKENSISKLSIARQIAFHQLLVLARKDWLADALLETLAEINQKILKEQLSEYVSEDALKILASAGIRDELVFPVPIILEKKPSLIAYYRLLLGSPQKTFYSAETGMGKYKSMERGFLRESHKNTLPFFCKTMGKLLGDLVLQIKPKITLQDISELPILTLGAQFQGGNNNLIGQKATESVFLSIKEVVKKSIVKEELRKLVLKNASGRKVEIKMGSDPDVQINEYVGKSIHPKVAIEIKGGTDRSNAHNRAGEAEKSHQKAKRKGTIDFWTIITLEGVDEKRLREESPTTTSWFDGPQVLGRKGKHWEDFRDRIASVVGIPV